MFMKKYLVKIIINKQNFRKHNDVSKELVKFLRCMNESKYLDNATKNFLKLRKEHMNLLKILLIQTLGAVEENKVKFISTPQGKKYVKILNSLKKNISNLEKKLLLFIYFFIVKNINAFFKKNTFKKFSNGSFCC